MRFVADLHVHSRYSRATSREADLAGYHRWARVKGIRVVGTGDFTHPAWMQELTDSLVEKDGLYELKEPPRGSAIEGVEPADTPVSFIPTTEISSIYRKHGRVRKVHSLIVVPTLEDARKVGARLAAIGNVASDGRPILGLDPKDLLSLILEINEEAFLIPAHIWTPWFSLYGSKSGFDTIEECFEELTPRIFALETGLSSDPPMNWRWSALDRYRLVSNSDAHSPPNLGREANLLDAEPSWRGVVDALRTGRGFLGTFEFYPEEGKYHFDGHRSCGVCMAPEETRKAGGLCPVCGKPLTVGVLSRVLELADRGEAVPPRPAEGFRSIIPLPELLAELTGAGTGSRAVGALRARIIAAYGSEYGFLLDAPIEDISRSQGALLAEAVRRMREGRVDARPGFDGVFGVIRVFDDAELARLRGQDELFPVAPRGGRKATAAAREEAPPRERAVSEGGRRVAAETVADAFGLDAEQRAIIEWQARRSLVCAGPGSGKTRLLVGWMASRVESFSAPGRALALTFTNRAAGELRTRLAALLRERASTVTATTFHSFCWSVLRERDPLLATVFTPSQRSVLLEELFPARPPARIRALAERMERCWEGTEEPDGELVRAMEVYQEALGRIGGADVSSLVSRLLVLLGEDAALRQELSARYRAIAVDELQDINRPQYELLLILCGTADAVLCIGDPDQAIYGFRGSDRKLFFDFAAATGARTFRLSRNYRSVETIVTAADAVMASCRAPWTPSPPAEGTTTHSKAVRGGGPLIRVARVADPGEEGRAIASAIRDLVGGVDSVSVDVARARGPGGYAFSDIAVLFRLRSVRDALLPALTAEGLPLALGANTPLSEEEPFLFLFAALRLVANPADPVSRRLLADHLRESGSAGSIEEFLERGPDLARKASLEGIGPVMDEILDGVVTFDRTLPEILLGEQTIRESAEEHAGNLPGFLAGVSLYARESEGSRRAERVALLTFHAAKGLEFPVVFIAGAEEGITPMTDDPEEERRLFYVAMTRARDVLYLTHCRRRSVHGEVRDATPSRFLDDIPGSSRIEEAPRRPSRGRQLGLFD